MTCKLNADTSDGLKIVSDTSGEIDLQIDASTKVHMASDGKVGIGTTSPDAALTVQRAGDSDITFKHTDGNTKAFSKFTISDTTFKQGTVGGDSFAFFTNNTEQMRIDSSGNVLIGKTTTGTTTNGIFLSADTGTNFVFPSSHYVIFNRNASGAATMLDFRVQNVNKGSISFNGTGTSYNTSSDYRLKENVNYTFDATTELKRLKPCKFNFIGESETVEGFIAHEVSNVVPLAVTGTKDATKVQDVYDDNGVKTGTETVPDYQGIDQSKLVPLLVKTIQELEARITALES